MTIQPRYGLEKISCNFLNLFEWTLFCFQDVIIYTADNRNVHCVDEVHFCCVYYLDDCFVFLTAVHSCNTKPCHSIAFIAVDNKGLYVFHDH
jgi:hypothetical protein